MGDATDRYGATAGLYDLMAASCRPAQLTAVESLLAVLRPNVGPILDLGAGSGLNTAAVLDRVPEAHLFAIEPSPSMRALI
ncbi:class I SAM-dependent methyltransferase, partial [Priestia megaterium]|uniref:class I SAM-dependent methyltransferase n=1 Tax=Priestia megaterium TaxID=1404 RepID=UPI001F34277C